MDLFRNSRRIAVQDRQDIAKTIGKSNKQGEECYFIEKKEKGGRGCFELKFIGGKQELMG